MHPKIALTIYIDRPLHLTEQMISAEYDMVISQASYSQTPQGFVRKLLMANRLGVFCGCNHPLSSQTSFDSNQLEASEWMVIGSASPFQDMILEFLNQIGVHRVITQFATVNDASILFKVLMQGRHLAVLPRTITRLMMKDYPLVELPMREESVMHNLYFWYKEELKENPIVRDLENIFKEILTKTEEL